MTSRSPGRYRDDLFWLRAMGRMSGSFPDGEPGSRIKVISPGVIEVDRLLHEPQAHGFV